MIDSKSQRGGIITWPSSILNKKPTHAAGKSAVATHVLKQTKVGGQGLPGFTTLRNEAFESQRRVCVSVCVCSLLITGRPHSTVPQPPVRQCVRSCVKGSDAYLLSSRPAVNLSNTRHFTSCTAALPGTGPLQDLRHLLALKRYSYPLDFSTFCHVMTTNK